MRPHEEPLTDGMLAALRQVADAGPAAPDGLDIAPRMLDRLAAHGLVRTNQVTGTVKITDHGARHLNAAAARQAGLRVQVATRRYPTRPYGRPARGGRL